MAKIIFQVVLLLGISIHTNAELQLASDVVLPRTGLGLSIPPTDAHLQQRSNDSLKNTLPHHHWELANSQDDIDKFQKQHDLILVDSVPQNAAMMPSWPQAFLQYFLITPFFDYIKTTVHTTAVNGGTVPHKMSLEVDDG